MNTLPNNSETAILKVYVILRTRRQAKDGKRLVGYSGGYPGFVSRILPRIDDGITVSVLANVYDTVKGLRGLWSNDWQPFNMAEELEIVDDTILNIAKGNHSSYFGELIKYEFDAKNKPSTMYRSGAKNHIILRRRYKSMKGFSCQT